MVQTMDVPDKVSMWLCQPYDFLRVRVARPILHAVTVIHAGMICRLACVLFGGILSSWADTGIFREKCCARLEGLCFFVIVCCEAPSKIAWALLIPVLRIKGLVFEAEVNLRPTRASSINTLSEVSVPCT